MAAFDLIYLLVFSSASHPTPFISHWESQPTSCSHQFGRTIPGVPQFCSQLMPQDKGCHRYHHLGIFDPSSFTSKCVTLYLRSAIDFHDLLWHCYSHKGGRPPHCWCSEENRRHSLGKVMFFHLRLMRSIWFTSEQSVFNSESWLPIDWENEETLANLDFVDPVELSTLVW